jgi:hypothetical protein
VKQNVKYCVVYAIADCGSGRVIKVAEGNMLEPIELAPLAGNWIYNIEFEDRDE